jgi:hypothetical protein
MAQMKKQQMHTNLSSEDMERGQSEGDERTVHEAVGVRFHGFRIQSNGGRAHSNGEASGSISASSFDPQCNYIALS